MFDIDPISFMQTVTPVSASTMLDARSGPNLDLFCVQQSDAFVKIMQSFILMRNT